MYLLKNKNMILRTSKYDFWFNGRRIIGYNKVNKHVWDCVDLSSFDLYSDGLIVSNECADKLGYNKIEPIMLCEILGKCKKY
jgi:hypothetical protein